MLWPVTGLIGTALASAAATRLLDHLPIRWWWRVPLLHGHALSLNLFWIGVALLTVAWIGLGRRLAAAGAAKPQPRDLIAVAALWALPLLLGPVLFSADMFSYLAQGSVLLHGFNPYHVAPAVLARYGEHTLLAAVSIKWHHTTAPYGPAFIALAGVAARLAGPRLALAIEFARLIELAGLALIAIFLPRLARRLGADPARAVWLVLASPLTLFYFVGSGHNDALMTGLLVAGVTLALEDRRLAGIALCALAAMVKLPAVVAIVVLTVHWLRVEPGRRPAVLATTLAPLAAVWLVIGTLTGVGLTWVSGNLFSTPAAARLAITPGTAIAVTIHELGHGVHTGVEYTAAGLESAAVRITMVLVLLFAAILCARVTRERLVRTIGVILIAAAVGGPAAWPWYLIWGTSLLAADPRGQRSPWLEIAVVVPVWLVIPIGDVAISLPQAYQLVIVYAAALAVAIWRHFTPPAIGPGAGVLPSPRLAPRPPAAGSEVA